MIIKEYISEQEDWRQPLLAGIHAIILKNDVNVTPELGKMMGTEMIIYNEEGVFKYGLGSAKEHLSLHLMPIYMNSALHAKFKALLPDAIFQKGCINFKSAASMPLPIVSQLIAESALIDLSALRAKYHKKKK